VPLKFVKMNNYEDSLLKSLL